MKVTEEIKNVGTYQHLGLRALSEIATLPEPERIKEHVTAKGEVDTTESITQICVLMIDHKSVFYSAQKCSQYPNLDSEICTTLHQSFLYTECIHRDQSKSGLINQAEYERVSQSKFEHQLLTDDNVRSLIIQSPNMDIAVLLDIVYKMYP